ncbi:MAG: hypothetical protein IPI92_18595 [Gemmatimonadetes bacterium]|nr:hypothetical protein [Gemmatimonadota bacterium]MBK7785095.1 hypothetical protein [Gemmatimonadota bacterium]
MPEPCELVDTKKAFLRFAFPGTKTQTSKHIVNLHWYVACRLVIEGGFDPESVAPRPPFRVSVEGRRRVLHHAPEAGGWSERTLLGGLKTKDVDVTVCLPEIGPVIAVSLKGTHNAFRNLTNRMEEAAGDCTNLHLAYPALVYGFWHLLRANEEEDLTPHAHFALEGGRYKSEDVAVAAGRPSPDILRYVLALERLSDREDLRDAPSRYEACALTLINVRGDGSGTPHSASPSPDQTLDYNRFFARIFALYDRRFVYQAPALKGKTERKVWAPDSPVLTDTIAQGGFPEMQPRMGSRDAEESD